MVKVTTKHYVQWTRSTVTAAARNAEVIVTSVNVSAAGASNEVQEGSLVRSVFIELWLENTASSGSFGVSVIKTPQAQTPAYVDMAALNGYSNKKNVLYHTQGLPPNDGVSGPIPVLRQWIKIPKGKQRFGLDDRLHLVISNLGTDTIAYCGFATYKEER